MFNLRRLSFIGFIKLMWRVENLRRIWIVSTALYFPLHLLLTGMIFFDFTIRETSPYIVLILDGPLGQVPWVIAFIPPIIISISLEAGLSALLISILLGMNFSGLYYIWKYAKCDNCSVNAASSGLSIIPSLLAVFSCCGGGILIAIFMSMGLGSLFTTILYPYSKVLVGLSTFLLMFNLYLIYRRGVGR